MGFRFLSCFSHRLIRNESSLILQLLDYPVFYSENSVCRRANYFKVSAQTKYVNLVVSAHIIIFFHLIDEIWDALVPRIMSFAVIPWPLLSFFQESFLNYSQSFMISIATLKQALAKGLEGRGSFLNCMGDETISEQEWARMVKYINNHCYLISNGKDESAEHIMKSVFQARQKVQDFLMTMKVIKTFSKNKVTSMVFVKSLQSQENLGDLLATVSAAIDNSSVANAKVQLLKDTLTRNAYETRFEACTAVSAKQNQLYLEELNEDLNEMVLLIHAAASNEAMKESMPKFTADKVKRILLRAHKTFLAMDGCDQENVGSFKSLIQPEYRKMVGSALTDSDSSYDECMPKISSHLYGLLDNSLGMSELEWFNLFRATLESNVSDEDAMARFDLGICALKRLGIIREQGYKRKGKCPSGDVMFVRRMTTFAVR